jgi:uncharacterized membrane protein
VITNDTDRDVITTVPRSMAWASLLCGLAGLAVSAYLTYEHFTASSSLACPDTGVVNCVKVTSSVYSTVAGVPVAVLGVLFFVALVPLLTPRAWSVSWRWGSRVRLAMVGLGMLAVLYLIWAELFRIHALCLWCTAVHLLTFATFCLVVFAEACRGPVAPRP